MEPLGASAFGRTRFRTLFGAVPVIVADGVGPEATVPMVRSVTGPAGPTTVEAPVELATGVFRVKSVQVDESVNDADGTEMLNVDLSITVDE
jgi:hypothetical protein